MAPPAFAGTNDPALKLKALMRNKPAGRAPIKRVHFNVPAGLPRTLVLAAGIVLKRGRGINFRTLEPPELVQLHFGGQTNEEFALVAGVVLKKGNRLDLAGSDCVTSIYVDEPQGVVSGPAVKKPQIQAAAAPIPLGERKAKIKAMKALASMDEEQQKIDQLLRETEWS